MEDHDNEVFRLVQINELQARSDRFTYAICDLCRLPYWKRVWIVQEIALARDMIYTSPSASLHRPTFERGLQYFLNLANKNWGHGFAERRPGIDRTIRQSELLEAFLFTPIF